jgi:hypothetical protein
VKRLPKLVLLTLLLGMVKFALPILALFTIGLALAQTTIPAVGKVVVPDYIWTIASVIIGWLVKEISSPLTALLKKRFGFTGSVTQYVYIFLSILFVVGFGLISGAFGGGAAGWWAALGALVTALVKGFGDYTKQVQTSAAGAAAALPPVIVTAAPQVLHPIDTPGTEPLHDLTGKVIGAVAPLTPGQPVLVSGDEAIK